MRKFRIVSLCLFINFLFISIPVYALTNTTLVTNADALNKLSILRGNNGDYNYDGQLKRSEATAFIVRIMGKEAFVSSNIDQYKFTNYPDVPSDQWYAPYVGYCTSKNILVGYINGDFGPNDNISEKAFLKMVIASMGYSYGDDFNWSNIYQTAFSLGLVTDISYREKVLDNVNYLRKSVIEVLYNSLTTKIKDENVRIIDKLISDGIVTKKLALATGVIKDEVATAINDINVTDSKKISVRFNEKINNINMVDINIYQSNDATKKLTTEIESRTDDTIILKTSEQTMDLQYSVEIHNITDMSDNITSLLLGTFKGYRSPEIKSDYFKISKIEPISKNIINLYFTHPINDNSEIASYYTILENGNTFIQSISQSMIVKRLQGYENGITIYIKDKVFTEGRDYTLIVSGDLTSIYGVKLMDGNGDSIPFKGKGTENEALNIVSILPLNSTSIQIEFNKEIDSNFAEKFLNYTITASNKSVINVNKAVVGGHAEKEGKIVNLVLMSPLEKLMLYKLRIEYIFDIFKQSSLESVEKAFAGTYPDKNDLSVLFTMVGDKGTISVYFNKPLNPEIAKMNVNYLIMGVSDPGYYSVPVKTYYSESNGYYVTKLYLPDNQPLKDLHAYKVVVYNSIQDVNGSMPPQNIEYKFTGNGIDIIKPEMSEAVIISNDSIRVSFKRELAYEVPNILPSNYTLEYVENGLTIRKIPIGVTYVDADTLALKFDSLDIKYQYTLKFNSLKDYSGIYNIGADYVKNSITVTVGK